jgi:restriction system protein
MMLPTVEALQQLGGSGNTDEIYAKVAEIMSLPTAVLAVPHGETSDSEVEYRLAWSRTYLKKYGVLERTARGVWAISPNAGDLTKLDPKEVVRSVRETDKAAGVKPGTVSTKTAAYGAAPLLTAPEAVPDGLSDVPEEASSWNVELHKVLLGLTPAAFERLIQRLLRESGFIQVDVTGKAGDGGIDGIGIARINGFLSFQVLFQAKRYQGSVSPSQIRDFRGAMQGRTDKGLFITTGTFTREAVKEATRDGAPPIDLIDGEQLIQRLKELRLGVKIEMVEAVEIDAAWFQKL